MKNRSLLALALALPLGLSTSSCATVAGTAASPLTGGVDLVITAVDADEWYWAPFAFVGGTIGGPFVAFYNGINFDAARMSEGAQYWNDFDLVFRPYEMLSRGDFIR